MRDLNAAALARATSTWPDGRVYLLGEVPPSPVTPYVVLSVGSGAPSGYTLDVTHGLKLHRLVAQGFGRTIAEVGFAVEKIDAAFTDHVLTVAGSECGPMAGDERVASPVTRDPDVDGLLGCTVLLPFTVSPA